MKMKKTVNSKFRQKKLFDFIEKKKSWIGLDVIYASDAISQKDAISELIHQ